jgi:hypothetical protein
MMQAAQQYNGQSGDRFAVGARLSVRRQRDLEKVELQRPHHAAESARHRIDLDEIEADAIRGDAAFLQRLHQRRLAERSAQDKVRHGTFTVG